MLGERGELLALVDIGKFVEERHDVRLGSRVGTEKINSLRRRPGYCLEFGGRSNPAKRSCTVTSVPPNIVAFSWSIARALSLGDP